MADEVLGREPFPTTIGRQTHTTRAIRKVFAYDHEYLLVHAPAPPTARRYRSTG